MSSQAADNVEQVKSNNVTIASPRHSKDSIAAEVAGMRWPGAEEEDERVTDEFEGAAPVTTAQREAARCSDTFARNLPVHEKHGNPGGRGDTPEGGDETGLVREE